MPSLFVVFVSFEAKTLPYNFGSPSRMYYIMYLLFY